MKVCGDLWGDDQLFLDFVCLVLHDICNVQHDKNGYDVVLAVLLDILHSPNFDETCCPSDSLLHHTYVWDDLDEDSACMQDTASAILCFCCVCLAVALHWSHMSGGVRLSSIHEPQLQLLQRFSMQNPKSKFWPSESC